MVEAVGIILGAHLLLTEDPEFVSKDSSISLDNQAVICATEHLHLAKPGHYLIDQFRALADRLKQLRESEYSLGMAWISGHDDAELNDARYRSLFSRGTSTPFPKCRSSDRANAKSRTLSIKERLFCGVVVELEGSASWLISVAGCDEVTRL